MAQFAYVVAASENYLPGLKALLKSMEMVGSEADVVIVAFQMPDILARLLVDRYAFPVSVIHVDGDNQVHGTAIERFQVAGAMDEFYDAICLLDADMFLTADPSLFFEIAAAGFIVGGSNGMIVDFNRAYQEVYGCFLGVDTYPFAKIHTTAPLFVGPRDLDWFRALYDSRRVDSWDDFLYLNLLGIKMGKSDRLLVMPPYTFTGIHHWGVKPETSWREKAGLFLSGTEEQVYMVHGKWWDEGWRSDLMLVMDRYFADETMGEKCRQRCLDAIESAYARFQELSE